MKHYNIGICNIIFQIVHVGTQNFLLCIQSSNIVLLENIFRIQLQDGYRKWHHSGLDWSAITRMGHKNVLTLCRNMLQLSELRQSRDLLGDTQVCVLHKIELFLHGCKTVYLSWKVHNCIPFFFSIPFSLLSSLFYPPFCCFTPFLPYCIRPSLLLPSSSLSHRTAYVLLPSFLSQTPSLKV